MRMKNENAIETDAAAGVAASAAVPGFTAVCTEISRDAAGEAAVPAAAASVSFSFLVFTFHFNFDFPFFLPQMVPKNFPKAWAGASNLWWKDPIWKELEVPEQEVPSHIL